MTIFLLTAVGFYLSKKQWFDENTGKLFSNLIIKLSLPAFMISNLTTSFSRESLNNAFEGAGAAFLTMIVTYVIGNLVATFLKVDKSRRGLFNVMFALSNTIFIGLPVNTAVFGAESTEYVLIYYITNTLFFWTIGVYGIRRDIDDRRIAFLSKKSLKNIISPPIITFAISIVIVLLDVRLPKFILSTCTYIGNLTTPLSLFFIGITLSRLNLKDIKFNRENGAILIGRFILAPLLIFLLIRNMDMPLLMKKVFILESAMPAMTQAAIVAEAYGGDHKNAAVTCMLTTAVSLVIIPIYIILFTIAFK